MAPGALDDHYHNETVYRIQISVKSCLALLSNAVSYTIFIHNLCKCTHWTFANRIDFSDFSESICFIYRKWFYAIVYGIFQFTAYNMCSRAQCFFSVICYTLFMVWGIKKRTSQNEQKNIDSGQYSYPSLYIATRGLTLWHWEITQMF